MKFKAIIFDMDGTITDSEHIWQQATRDLITSKGISITDEQHLELDSKIKGLILPKSCAIIKDMFGLEHDIQALAEEKQKRALALLAEGLRFIDGFERFHKTVIDSQVMVGIATNADDPTLAKSKEHLMLEKYFGEHIYNITHVNNKGKPEPDIYLHVARQLGVEPEYCIVFEDSAHGVRAAKRAGMFCVGINTARNRAALHEADLIIEHYDEVELNELLIKKEIKKIG